ncbi:uncharacterized protein LOC135491387 isoform X2 [Lineus longissimus]|uniref:uncharacterized protein LOC135491387 isoform X2 n=1 Tax=Lineus longissimus TaxID=88925 RepID=UPI00315DB4B1
MAINKVLALAIEVAIVIAFASESIQAVCNWDDPVEGVSFQASEAGQLEIKAEAATLADCKAACETVGYSCPAFTFNPDNDGCTILTSITGSFISSIVLPGAVAYFRNCVDSPHCSGTPCMNAATCYMDDGNPACYCTYGWQGELCDEPTQRFIVKTCTGLHIDCNNGSDPNSLAYSKCDTDNTCVCMDGYFQHSPSHSCIPIVPGTPCSHKPSPDAFCEVGIPHSKCGASDECECDTGFYIAINNWGQQYCKHFEPGSSCSTDADCQSGMTDGVCVDGECECPVGKEFVFSAEACITPSSDVACSSCKLSGGVCYDSNSDSSPDTCACPPYKQSTNPSDFTVGCDVSLVDPGKLCDSEGVQSVCRSPNAQCIHAKAVSQHHQCQCKLTYQAVPERYNPDYNAKCVKVISKFTDPNCKWCARQGGVCVDINGDYLRDDCMCPETKSSSSHAHPKFDCDTDHDEMLPMCGVKKMERLDASTTYSTEVRIQRGKTGQGIFGWSDFTFSAYCTYYKTVGAEAGEGGVKVKDRELGLQYASEGVAVAAQLEISVQDKFGRDAEETGLTMGDDVQLIVQMTDDADAYTKITVETCVAADRPNLDDPAVQTILLLNDGCPIGSSDPSFELDPTDPNQTLLSEYFPSVSFEGSSYVFFHCAIRVCRQPSECPEVSCYRKRRSLSGRIRSYQDILELVEYDWGVKSGVSTGGIYIRPKGFMEDQSNSGVDEDRNTMERTCPGMFGICGLNVTMFVTIIAGFSVTSTLTVAASILYRLRKRQLEKTRYSTASKRQDSASSTGMLYAQAQTPSPAPYLWYQSKRVRSCTMTKPLMSAMLLLLVWCFCALYVACTGFPQHDGYMHRYGDCSGGDIKRVDYTKTLGCWRRCNEMANCKSFLWVENVQNVQSSYCWLKTKKCAVLTSTNNARYHTYTKIENSVDYTARFGDCPGNEIKRINQAMKADRCKNECNIRQDCQSFLHVKQGSGSYCSLKNSRCPNLTNTHVTNFIFYNKKSGSGGGGGKSGVSSYERPAGRTEVIMTPR